MSLHLFDTWTRSVREFTPLKPGEVGLYTCGPTVYNYQHIGNMRAYVFADTLGRVLSYKGYKLTHVINITDVGHLTSDADAGDDKMEKAAAAQGKTSSARGCARCAGWTTRAAKSRTCSTSAGRVAAAKTSSSLDHGARAPLSGRSDIIGFLLSRKGARTQR